MIMYGNYAPFYRGGYFNPMQTPTMPNMAENQNQWQLQNMQQPLNQPTQTPTNDMIFVLNENEASSFPVAPNNRVVLWDKNQTTFYVKSANAQGIPSMQIFDFSERVQNAPQTPTEHVCKCGDNFVTKDDFNALKGDFEALSKRFEETAVTQVIKPNKNVKKGDE
jgi:hypothetical protein